MLVTKKFLFLIVLLFHLVRISIPLGMYWYVLLFHLVRTLFHLVCISIQLGMYLVRTSIVLGMYFYYTWYVLLLHLVCTSIALGMYFYCTWYVLLLHLVRTSIALGPVSFPFFIANSTSVLNSLISNLILAIESYSKLSRVNMYYVRMYMSSRNSGFCGVVVWWVDFRRVAWFISGVACGSECKSQLTSIINIVCSIHTQ